MNHNFDFQGCQKMHIRVAISQKGLIGLFANWCHLMLLGPKEWKHKSKVLRTHFKNFFIPGTLCPNPTHPNPTSRDSFPARRASHIITIRRRRRGRFSDE